MQPLGLPVLPEVNSSAHSALKSACCATTSVWHGGIRLSVSIRRARPSVAPFVTCMRSGVATSRSACDSSSWKDNSSGADVGVDRNDRNPERIEREPMQKEDRTIFEQQGNPRPASIAGGGVFAAQPVDLGLEGAVFDSEILAARRTVPRWQAPAGMARPAASRPWPRRHRMAIDTCRGSLRTQLLLMPAAAASDGSRNPHAALAAAAAFVNTLSLNYLVGQVRSIADLPGESPGGAGAVR